MKPEREIIISKALDYYDKMKHQESSCEPEDGLIYALEELDPGNEISMAEHETLKRYTEIRCILREIENSPALQKDYRFETLPENVFAAAGGSFPACEDTWMPVTVQDAETMTKSAYDCADSGLTAESAMEVLETGIALRLPLVYIRLRTEQEKCPLCASSIPAGTAALSRRDNTTQICEACGVREALDNYCSGNAEDSKARHGKKRISELSAGEAMDELTFRAFAAILRRARRSYEHSGSGGEEVYQALDDMCIDAEAAPAEASGTDNLREAVRRFVQESKGSERRILRDVRAAYGKED